MPSADRFKCYIREEFHLIPEHNPISRHAWHTHGPTISWVVVGPTGVCSRHRTPQGADKALIEWQDYFDRDRELHERMREGIRQMRGS